MYCSKCGKELTGKERFCPRCGNEVSLITENDIQQTVADNVSSTKSKNEEYEQKKRAGRTGKKSHRGRKILLTAACCLILALIGITAYHFIFRRMAGEQYLAAVQNEEGKWGYIDEKANEVIECQYDVACPFNENGLAAVGQKNGDTYSYYGESYDLYEWMLIDTRGKETGSLSQFDIVSSEGAFSENGLLIVGKMIGVDEDGDAEFKWGYADETGSLVLECVYSQVSSWNEDGLAVVLNESDEYVAINEKGDVCFNRGDSGVENFPVDESDLYLAANKAGEDEDGDIIYEYGFVDKTGKVVIDYQFSGGADFSESGLAAVEKDGKWGYINKKGETVIPFRYEWANAFAENGLAYVELENGGQGYINTNDDMVITLDSSVMWTYDFIGNIALISNDDSEVLIDSNGNEIFSCNGNNSYITGSGDEKYWIVINTDIEDGYLYGCINDKGEMIIPLKYNYMTLYGANGWIAAGIKTGELNESEKTYKVEYLDKSGEIVLELPEEYINGSAFTKVGEQG